LMDHKKQTQQIRQSITPTVRLSFKQKSIVKIFCQIKIIGLTNLKMKFLLPK
jgi:hypothetical protein